MRQIRYLSHMQYRIAYPVPTSSLGYAVWQISLHKECNQSSYTKCNQSPYTKCVTDLQYLPMCTYNFSLSRKKLIFNMRYRLSPTLSFHGAIHHCHCCAILCHCSHVEQRSVQRIAPDHHPNFRTHQKRWQRSRWTTALTPTGRYPPPRRKATWTQIM